MKFNWGTGIFLFLIIFIGLAVAFMIFAFNQEISLVHKDYYKKGVDYDQEISMEKKSAKYTDLIIIKTDNNNIELIFDESIKNKSTDIEVYFYSPSEQHHDYKIRKDNISNGFVINKSELNKDRYIVNVEWVMDNTKYRIKKEFINK